ncbi:MAG: serine hydrolase [Armatimonadetes bacterium]|nr:serine hydrolase [Armatimonadota bacterium]
MKLAKATAFLTIAFALAVGTAPFIAAQQQNRESYDYFGPNRQLVARGMQALILCNGLFTSGRSLEDVYRHELQIQRIPLLHPQNGDVQIDRNNKTVTVGRDGNDPIPVMRAVYREGLGCIVMSPDQTLADIDDLPILKMPPLSGNAARIDWPDGDRTDPYKRPTDFDKEALQEASDWLFDPELHGNPSQVTLSLLVLYKGQIVHERYENGANVGTKTRTWSAAKSIAVTLIGMLVDRGELSLDEPLDVDWLPRTRDSEHDARRNITLRNVLNMSSGLDTVDNAGNVDVTGSGLSYWAGRSSADGARSRRLQHDPDAHWDYENYDTLLAVLAMKRVIGDDQEYLEFPRKNLFDKIGMRNTVPGVDRFGDFVFSSQVYTTARDLARFGLLYMNDGVWNGERLISSQWIEFCRTPAPASSAIGDQYGGQWWLVPTNTTGVPRDAFVAAGNRGNYVIVIPSKELVIVRRGLDRSARGDRSYRHWDIARQVLTAFPN